MNNHTKGEWLLERSGLTEMQYDIDTDDNSTLIARVGTKEDAQLISAAPDLLEFAQEIRIICKRILVGRSDGFDIKELRQMAEDVIKKATL